MAELAWLIDPIYIVTIYFFNIGMQRMSHPLTARSVIVWAGAAMLIARPNGWELKTMDGQKYSSAARFNN